MQSVGGSSWHILGKIQLKPTRGIYECAWCLTLSCDECDGVMVQACRQRYRTQQHSSERHQVSVGSGAQGAQNDELWTGHGAGGVLDLIPSLPGEHPKHRHHEELAVSYLVTIVMSRRSNMRCAPWRCMAF